jgi:hypothetical protein
MQQSLFWPFGVLKAIWMYPSPFKGHAPSSVVVKETTSSSPSTLCKYIHLRMKPSFDTNLSHAPMCYHQLDIWNNGFKHN